jgi:hypothetical protein
MGTATGDARNRRWAVALFRDTKPSAEATAIRNFVRDRLIDACHTAYKDNIETWRGIELKAQITATIGTFFIGAIFTFVKDMSQHGSAPELFLLAVALFFVVVSMVLCVTTLWIQTAPYPPVGKYGDEKGLDDALWDHMEIKSDRELEESFIGILGDYYRAWNQVNQRLRPLVQRKGEYVLWAQRCMIPAVLAVVILTLLRLFSAATTVGIAS